MSKRRETVIKNLSKEFRKLEAGEDISLTFTIPAKKISVPAHISWQEAEHASIDYDDREADRSEVYWNEFEKAQRLYIEKYNGKIKTFNDKAQAYAKMFGEDWTNFWSEIYHYAVKEKRALASKKAAATKAKRDALIASAKEKIAKARLTKKEQKALGI